MSITVAFCTNAGSVVAKGSTAFPHRQHTHTPIAVRKEASNG